MLTLNHVLAGERIWLSRFTGAASGVTSLDQVLYPEFDLLGVARAATDEQIVAYVEGLGEAELARPLTYRTLSDARETWAELGPILTHFFNHQTHHRGPKLTPCSPRPRRRPRSISSISGAKPAEFAFPAPGFHPANLL